MVTEALGSTPMRLQLFPSPKDISVDGRDRSTICVHRSLHLEEMNISYRILDLTAFLRHQLSDEVFNHRSIVETCSIVVESSVRPHTLIILLQTKLKNNNG
jgi:hypothetical protein